MDAILIEARPTTVKKTAPVKARKITVSKLVPGEKLRE
tara:strand:- start:525 stop:638 length:114 start_codon:yes stop_codon:yes gene_type:complete